MIWIGGNLYKDNQINESSGMKKPETNPGLRQISKMKRLGKIKKQPPEVFCKKRFSEKLRKIYRTTPAPGSVF